MRKKVDLLEFKKNIFRGVVDAVCDAKRVRRACCLPYGRNKRGHLKSALESYVKSLFLPSADEVIWNLEAMGVDLTETCKRVDIELEWLPEKKVYRIALIARRK